MTPEPHHDGLADRLLAEAVRIHAETDSSEETAASDVAREAGGTFEARILHWARHATTASSLIAALGQLRSSMTLIRIGMSILVALAGAATARAALASPGDDPVNFYWALGSVLGVQTIALLLWLVFMAINPRALASGSLGGLVFGLGRRFARWLHQDSAHLASARATTGVYATGALGRWTFSVISHAMWAIFLVSCLITLLVSLAIRQHSFAWETTILSAETYVPLTKTIAIGPGSLGFKVPDEAQIRASRWTGEGTPPSEDVRDAESTQDAWSGLLLGSVIVYGISPRALLLLLCIVLQRRAASRFRLDLSLPGYARLRPSLMPESVSLGIVDGDEDVHTTDALSIDKHPLVSDGPIAVLGFELQALPDPWPPALRGAEWIDLGLVDDRGELRKIASTLEASPRSPRLLMVVASLTTTPDRGVRSFLAHLNGSISSPLALVLSGGDALRRRLASDQIPMRIADWRDVAQAAGMEIDRVVDVDLEHLTDTSRARLATLAGLSSETVTSVRRIDQAFSVIEDHAAQWSGSPGEKKNAALYREIAGLFEHSRDRWAGWLKVGFDPQGDVAAQIRAGASGVFDQLPGRLKASPKWLAIGAAAGAFGCVATTMLVTPAAFAALPLWTGFGAAMSGIVNSLRSDEADQTSETGLTSDLSEGVAGAALYAVLLDLQGRDETAITRVLDRTMPREEPELMSMHDVASWLGDLSHRYDLALAEEASS